jgi:hypothetical protein
MKTPEFYVDMHGNIFLPSEVVQFPLDKQFFVAGDADHRVYPYDDNPPVAVDDVPYGC